MNKVLSLPIITLILMSFLIVAYVLNEQDWSKKRVSEENEIRAIIGLPSIALGTKYGATRNPLLELYCTSLYDLPGGYCYIMSASFIDTPLRDPVYFRTVPEFNMTAFKELKDAKKTP